jgi:uncharacterized membrane protein YphA (DoxX/SURF4 family)
LNDFPAPPTAVAAFSAYISEFIFTIAAVFPAATAAAAAVAAPVTPKPASIASYADLTA